jgi:hypothetical protein
MASHVILNRISIYCTDAYGNRNWVRGIMVHGDAEYGPVRGPYIVSAFIDEPHDYGFQISQDDSAATCDINDVTTFTEAVAAGIRVNVPWHSGIKVYGAARLRFTECEGGLDVIGDNDSTGNGISEYSITVDGSAKHYAKGVYPIAQLYFNDHLTRLHLRRPSERNIWAERGAAVIDSGYCSNVFFEILHSVTYPAMQYMYQVYADSNSTVKLSIGSPAFLVESKKRWMIQDSVNRFYADATSAISIVRAWWSSDTTSASTYGSTSKLGTAASTYIVDTTAFSGPDYGQFADNKLWFCDEGGNQSYYKTFTRPAVIASSSPHILEVYPNPVSNSNITADGIITLGLTLIKGGYVSVAIYDEMGKLVKTVAAANWMEKGVHFFHWRGNGASNESVAVGRYYAVVHTAEGINVEPLVLTK